MSLDSAEEETEAGCARIRAHMHVREPSEPAMAASAAASLETNQ